MSYYTPEQLDEFYRPYLEDTFPFSQYGQFSIYEHPESGELAHIAIVPELIDTDALRRLVDIIDWEAGYAHDEATGYWFSSDHCSDTGPEGWNYTAVIECEDDTSSYPGLQCLIEVNVPLPSRSADEYNDFPAEEILKAAMSSVFDQIFH